MINLFLPEKPDNKIEKIYKELEDLAFSMTNVTYSTKDLEVKEEVKENKKIIRPNIIKKEIKKKGFW